MQSARSHASILPPPNFILMPAVGIDISDRGIKYAELIPTDRGNKLGRFGRLPLPPGVVEGGKIVNSAALTAALDGLRAKEHFSFVRATLPEEQVYFFRTRFSGVPRDMLRETLELSLEQYVPVAAADTGFDFEIVHESNGEIEVAVTAATHAVVDSYVHSFGDAGLTLLSLEVEAEAIARAVIRPDDMTAHLIVDFGETRTGISISCGGQLYFTSTVSIGGQMLTETLAKHFNIPIAEAEAMKREYGLRRNGPHQDLFSLLLNNIAVLRDEISKHFLYWHSHEKDGLEYPPIEEVVLVGGDSNLPGLADYLAVSLKVRTVMGDVWTRAKLPEGDVPDITLNDSLGFAAAIGLAVRETD